MLTLDIIKMLKNTVISIAKQHHINDNYNVRVFGNSEISEIFKSEDKTRQAALTKLKSKVQHDAPGFFSMGKAIYIVMHQKKNSEKGVIGPEDGMKNFSKLVKNAILANPSSVIDLVSEKSIVVVNAYPTDEPEKTDNYYFAGFKLNI